MTDAITGFGTTIAGGSTLSSGISAYTIPIPEGSVDDIDLTSPDSTNKWKVHTAGFKDAGSLVVEIHFDKANVAEIISAKGGANETWTITFSDGSTYACSGYISGIGGEAPYAAKVPFRFSIQLSGEPTFTPAA